MRPHPELIASFAENATVKLFVPRTKRSFHADAAALRMLAAVCDRSGEQLTQLRDRYDDRSIDRALDALMRLGVVVESDDDAPIAQAWQDWGEAAWFPHLMTRDIDYAETDTARHAVGEQLRGGPEPPSPYKCDCDRSPQTHTLPRPTLLDETSLAAALLARRTARFFGDEPLTAQQLADLLFYTAGPLFEEQLDIYGCVLRKCSPSPGARHPTEVYCALTSAGDLPRGIYHYCTRHHALALRAHLDAPDWLDGALVGQRWFSSAPAVFFFTCVRNRLAWKYRSARAYLIAHLESGHYGQTFVLVATALGLGAFQTAAFSDSAIESALDVDGVDEFVMYATGAGHPHPQPAATTRRLRMSEHLPDRARVVLGPGDANAWPA